MRAFPALLLALCFSGTAFAVSTGPSLDKPSDPAPRRYRLRPGTSCRARGADLP